MPSAQAVPQWMRLARKDVGTTEVRGNADNPKVMKYYRDVGQDWVKHDEIHWCAAFVGSCLERSGISSSRSLRARSYQKWGHRLSKPRAGCIVVLSRGSNPAHGHIGFFVRETRNHVVLLGGNQSDAVNERRFSKSRVLAWRWPSPSSVKHLEPQGTAFEAALDHVLEFEGGFSDHPADPGGPTFKGVTIGLLASHLGTRLGAWKRSTLVAGVKALKGRQVRMIYRHNFWRTTSAGSMPRGVDLMLFDAAVQHGPGRAIRMLQRAVSVEADGEIGPVTKDAVRALGAAGVVRAMGASRRAFYKSLKHFTHFGRGWMRRLDSTIARGLKAAGARSGPKSKSDQTNPSTKQKEISKVTTKKKWWVESVTIWGTLITALSTVLPIIGPFIGLDVSSVMIEQFGAAVALLIQALGGVIGTFLAVYGRLRASAGLTQRQVSLSV